MRVSEAFALDRSQGELDFVDVHVDRDTALFVDPATLRHINGTWARECVALVQDFFQTVINAIGRGEHGLALELLRGLREPNETRLGLSRGAPRGHALGPDSSEDIFDALEQSEATRTGLLQHLEDTALLVRGIGRDIISDITTNLIRSPLLAYTERIAGYYAIPLTAGVVSGPLWDPAGHAWTEGRQVPMPIAQDRRLLLVPKSIVRQDLSYDTDEYLTNFILPVLEHREIAANSELVRTIKYNGTKKVARKDLIAKYGAKKEEITRVTLDEKGAPLAQYRRVKEANPTKAPDHIDMVAPTGSDVPDFTKLVTDIRAVAPGGPGASAYHSAVERLLSAIFTPSLTMPTKELSIHEGRKRIDIAYTNAGIGDFFAWVAQHHPAPNIFIECKNYSGDPANPELDQLAGRFSPSRGKVGFLCCRTFDDKALFISRCRDTALDDRGFIIVLDDDDLEQLAVMRSASDQAAMYVFFKTRFDELI